MTKITQLCKEADKLLDFINESPPIIREFDFQIYYFLMGLRSINHLEVVIPHTSFCIFVSVCILGQQKKVTTGIESLI